MNHKIRGGCRFTFRHVMRFPDVDIFVEYQYILIKYYIYKLR